MAELRFGLRLKTAKFISSLEDWLARNCLGEWDIRLDGVSDDLNSKSYLFRFELSDDLKWFKYAVGQHSLPDRPDLGGRGKSAARRAGAA